ncbi:MULTISPECIES: hypothetical protein [Chitinophagaceae]|uniref:hypothetical protein n=1 Tax=Chitinophagaceae TaxID=563835 RepID=UPI000DEF1634|nr:MULTISPECIES: hypothetical protein [Chitinophagaceae]RPD48891.1 hypothetical protein DRJ53_09525 [Paracnuella aquatica]
MQPSKIQNTQKQVMQPVLAGAGRPVSPLERSRSAATTVKGDPASGAVGSYPVPNSGRFAPGGG